MINKSEAKKYLNLGKITILVEEPYARMHTYETISCETGNSNGIPF